MINQKKVLVVLPAYNAEKTLERTYREIPRDIVDQVLLVDDDRIESFLHDRNYGYGRNQKTCYREALKRGADIIVMLHPDYQYTPKLLTAMASMIAFGVYDVVLGSRIIGGGALEGGMPFYKYVANRFLTALGNLLLGSKLSEFHTGYRAFSREVLESLPLHRNSDDFVFDNEMLAQVIRGILPHPLLRRGIVHRPVAQPRLRPGRSPDQRQVPAAPDGDRPFRSVRATAGDP